MLQIGLMVLAAEVLYRELLEQEIIPTEYRCKAASGPRAPSYSRIYERMNPTSFDEKKPATAK